VKDLIIYLKKLTKRQWLKTSGMAGKSLAYHFIPAEHPRPSTAFSETKQSWERKMSTYKIRRIEVDFPFEADDCQLVYMEKKNHTVSP
jgi:hypothetical protein